MKDRHREAWTALVEGKEPKKRSKYKNIKVEFNGRVYDSIKEANHAFYLQKLEEQGQIKNLEYQVRFPLIPKQFGEREVAYFADFTFFRDGKLIVQDVKGFITREYKRKRRLMKHIHGITIEEL
jgi:hypothetical protein